MIRFSTILRSIKPFLGGVTVTVDRIRQQIHFTRNGSTEVLTVDQLFDEIETIFSSAKAAGPASVPAERAPARLAPIADNMRQNEPSWLTVCDKPQTNVLARL